MTDDHSQNKESIIPIDSNTRLSLPSEIVNRGLELAVRLEQQRSVQQYQQPIRYFAGIHATSCIDFSKNGRFAAITSYAGSGGEDPDLIIWDATNGDSKVLSLRERGKHFSGWFYSVAISGSGDLALAGYDDGGTVCWDVEKEQLRDFRGKTYNTYKDAAICLAFSPDEQWFAHNNSLHTRIIDSKTGEDIRQNIKGLGGVSYCNEMAISNDGSKLLLGSGQYDKFMELIDLEGRQEALLFRSAIDIRAVDFFPDNQKLISLDGDGIITLWDAKSGEEITNWSHSKTLAEVSDDCSSEQLGYLTFDNTNPHRNRVLLHCPFRSVIVSLDGQRILSGGGNKNMYLWTLDGHEICEYTHNTQVIKVAFLPDGQHALSGCWDGSVYLWELPH